MKRLGMLRWFFKERLYLAGEILSNAFQYPLRWMTAPAVSFWRHVNPKSKCNIGSSSVSSFFSVSNPLICFLSEISSGQSEDQTSYHLSFGVEFRWASWPLSWPTGQAFIHSMPTSKAQRRNWIGMNQTIPLLLLRTDTLKIWVEINVSNPSCICNICPAGCYAF